MVKPMALLGLPISRKHIFLTRHGDMSRNFPSPQVVSHACVANPCHLANRILRKDRYTKPLSKWWFETFFDFILIPTWGNDPFWLNCFNWMAQLRTSGVAAQPTVVFFCCFFAWLYFGSIHPNQDAIVTNEGLGWHCRSNLSYTSPYQSISTNSDYIGVTRTDHDIWTILISFV